MPIMPKLPARKEAMRIAGKLVTTDDVIEVKNPYDGSLVGTVPMARPEHVREAFQKARISSRSFRATSATDPAENGAIAARPPRGIRRLISAESGLCWKDAIYESTRAYDVWSFAGQLAIKDDGEQFSCDISPNGKARKIFTTRVPLLGVISAITPFNHPLNMVSHKLAPPSPPTIASC